MPYQYDDNNAKYGNSVNPLNFYLNFFPDSLLGQLGKGLTENGAVSTAIDPYQVITKEFVLNPKTSKFILTRKRLEPVDEFTFSFFIGTILAFGIILAVIIFALLHK